MSEFVPHDLPDLDADLDADTPTRPGVEYVGFVGCAKVGLLAVRVHSRAKHVMRVACTCGEVHIAKDPMIRERQPSDVVALIEEGTPMQIGDDPAPAAAVERAAPKSDPDVLAAIPDDWTAVTDVAEALGYGNRGSFVNRLREMRERGAAIETRKKNRTAPMFVRRTEAS